MRISNSGAELGCTVVVNEEEQYSVCPTCQRIPLGWRTTGKSGSRAECLAYIEEVWTDMRPLTVRRLLGSARLPRGGG